VPLQLDHVILAVNDPTKSVDFYTRILGFTSEGQREPFSVVRITPDLVLQLAPWGTKGGEHLAFAMTRGEFEDVFGRVRAAGIAYGDVSTPWATCAARERRRVRRARASRCTSSIRAST